MRRPLRTTLIVLGVLALAVVLYDRLQVIRWVGSTELIVEIHVIDVETGQPVDGAVLDIYAEDKRLVDGRENPVRFIAAQDGIVRHVIPSMTTGGTQSGQRFTDTYSVRPLDWMILSVTASGYQSPEPFSLTDPPYRRKTVPVGPGKDQFVVPIAVRKSAK